MPLVLPSMSTASSPPYLTVEVSVSPSPPLTVPPTPSQSFVTVPSPPCFNSRRASLSRTSAFEKCPSSSANHSLVCRWCVLQQSSIELSLLHDTIDTALAMQSRVDRFGSPIRSLATQVYLCKCSRDQCGLRCSSAVSREWRRLAARC